MSKKRHTTAYRESVQAGPGNGAGKQREPVQEDTVNWGSRIARNLATLLPCAADN
jgi:hypothetical protein